MRKASVTDLKTKLGRYIKASKSGPVVVTKNGKTVAVLLSMQDEEELERLLMAYSPKLQRILQAAKKQIREGRGIKHKEFWAEANQQQVAFTALLQSLEQTSFDEIEKTLATREKVKPTKGLSPEVVKALKNRITKQKASA